MIEYSLSTPRALVEYKHVHGRMGWEENSHGHKAVATLGTMAGIPAFVLFYDEKDLEHWWVSPLNRIAEKHYPPGPLTAVTETDWINKLLEIRGRTPYCPKCRKPIESPAYVGTGLGVFTTCCGAPA
jgi:hypothetical protein